MIGASQAWVLNLSTENDRLTQFRRQPLAETFDTFAAIDMRSTTEADWVGRFDTEQFLRRYGRRPAPGEVGCCLSHTVLVEQLAQTLGDNDRAIVCEDDAVLLPGLSDVLSRSIPARFDIVTLGIVGTEVARRQGFLPIAPWAAPRRGHRVGVQWPAAWAGTVGYLITGRAARRMASITEVTTPSWLADDFTFWSDQGICVAGVRPMAVLESNHGSTIGPHSRGAVAAGDSAARLIHRHQQFLGVPRERKVVWLAVEDLRSRLPGRLRYRLPIGKARRFDRWTTVSWRDGIAR